MPSARTRLLDAAEQLLRTSAGAVTVESTAELAGLARSTAYRHFAGRDDLFLELANLRSTRLLDRAVTIVAGDGTAAARLEAVFVFLFHELPRDPVLSGLIAEGPRSLDTPSARESAQAFLEPLIIEAQLAHEFRADYPPREAVRWLITQLVTTINLHAEDEAAFRNWFSWFILPSMATPVTAHGAANAAAATLRAHARAINHVADRLDLHTSEDSPG